MKPLKQHLKGLSVSITDGKYKYDVEMASGGMIYIPNFIKNDSGTQVTLRILPQ
jgi:hypothetical protein